MIGQALAGYAMAPETVADRVSVLFALAAGVGAILVVTTLFLFHNAQSWINRHDR